MVQLPLWAAYCLVIAVPVAAVLSIVVTGWSCSRRHRRESELNHLRWACAQATSGNERQRRLGVAELAELYPTRLGEKAEAMIKAALDVMLDPLPDIVADPLVELELRDEATEAPAGPSLSARRARVTRIRATRSQIAAARLLLEIDQFSGKKSPRGLVRIANAAQSEN